MAFYILVPPVSVSRIWESWSLKSTTSNRVQEITDTHTFLWYNSYTFLDFFRNKEMQLLLSFCLSLIIPKSFLPKRKSKSVQPILYHCPLSIPPENIKKALVFCFQGVQKESRDMKWFKNLHNILRHYKMMLKYLNPLLI